MGNCLIFFDHTCSLCQGAVQHIQTLDSKHLFSFFPLQSEKAKEVLKQEILEKDTIVLVDQEKKVWIRSRAIFRIVYLLGGKHHKLAKVFSKTVIFDPFYRFIAHSRHLFLPK